MAKKHGGYTQQDYYGASIHRAKKRALVVIPIPNAQRKPDLIVVQSMDDVLDSVGAKFRVKLSRINGSSQTEEFAIRTFDDFEESGQAEQSDVLQQQKVQSEFLHTFHEELSSSPSLQAEIDELLRNKKNMLAFLKALKSKLQSPENQLLKLLEIQ